MRMKQLEQILRERGYIAWGMFGVGYQTAKKLEDSGLGHTESFVNKYGRRMTAVIATGRSLESLEWYQKYSA